LAIQKHHIDHYRTHGYFVLENFLSAKELAAVRDEIKELLPGWVEFCDNPERPKPEGWRDSQRILNEITSIMHFPFPGTALNAVTLHPALRDFAAQMAGHVDLRCEQSSLNAKCKDHPRDEDQDMHCDFQNHTLAYPPDRPTYWQTAYLIYYTDVTLDHAPTAVCSKVHYPEKIIWPARYLREDRPTLYSNEKKVTVPAGSLLAYSMRTFHRGTKFLADVGRIGHFITYAPTTWQWLGIDGLSARAIPDKFRDWIELATPEERTTMGFPLPGHDYWTEETIAGVSARYPGMDMAPYQI